MTSLTPNIAVLQENTPTVFDFSNHAVRVLLDEKQTPLFVAKDVAKALSYSDVTNAIKQHCKGVAKHHPITDNKNRTQNMRVIYEPDVYRLIFGSKLKSAIKFQDWVFEEVLPQIRQTGQYQNYQLLDQFNKAVLELEKATDLASQAGRMLNLAGKKFKPKAKKQVIELRVKINPLLPFVELK